VEEVNSIRLMKKWTFPPKGCFLLMKFGHLVRQFISDEWKSTVDLFVFNIV
jgi:hypothetical protein